MQTTYPAEKDGLTFLLDSLCLVRVARDGLPRVLNNTIPAFRTMDGIHSERSISRLQREQVRCPSEHDYHCGAASNVPDTAPCSTTTLTALSYPLF